MPDPLPLLPATFSPADDARLAPGEPRRRPRTLALELVDALGERIRDGRLATGDKLPTEAAIMAEFGVSRTVVREAISKLQASGLVQTRHGIGTFVAGLGDTGFRIAPDQFETLRDVIAVLELRIGIETEAAALAAQRRSDDDLRRMRAALDAVAEAIQAGRDAVAADFQFHQEIARATQNSHFAELMGTLGARIIPRARLAADQQVSDEQRHYLRRVHGEHESIYDAIAGRDADGARAAMRTHLANSRERRRRASAGGEGAAETPTSP
jgi:GntR family transcriptional regulator, transcriptional repressor for pyruvate dehydrogenase complex